MAKEKALLIDIKRCIGCMSCETACKQLHGFSTDPEPVLSDTAFTVVETRNDKFVRKLCMHCDDPACASACPVGAISKMALGPVVYDADKCIGCRYCMLACPYQVPRYQWTKLAPFVKKCDLCVDRVKAGKPTACAEACPVQATVFGDRDELDQRGLEPHSQRFLLRAAHLGRGRAGWRQRAVRLRRALREAGIQASAQRQSADAVTDGKRAGRLAQGSDHGWNDSFGAVLGNAASP